MRALLSLSCAALLAGCTVGSGRIIEAPGFGGERSLCLEGMDVLYGANFRTDYRFWSVTCDLYFSPRDPGNVTVLFMHTGEEWEVRYPEVKEFVLSIDGARLVVPAQHAFRRCSRWVWEYVWGTIPVEAVERMARAGEIRGTLGEDDFDLTRWQRERVAEYAACMRRELAQARTRPSSPAPSL